MNPGDTAHLGRGNRPFAGQAIDARGQRHLQEEAHCRLGLPWIEKNIHVEAHKVRRRQHWNNITCYLSERDVGKSHGLRLTLKLS